METSVILEELPENEEELDANEVCCDKIDR